MKRTPYSRKSRQLDRLIKELKKKLSTDSCNALLIERLKQKISLLLKQLAFILSKHQVVSKLGSLAILFGFAFTNSANAQLFTGPIMNPFGLTQNNSEFSEIEFVDIDSDGDLDILQGGYYGLIHFHENSGTASAPNFLPYVDNPFGISPSPGYLNLLATADIDNDGDMDILSGQLYGEMHYFENTGTPTSPAFGAPVVNPFGLISSDQFASPTFVDLDNDGDMDLLVGEYYGLTKYYENIGTASSPSFAAPLQNPYGITQVDYIGIPETADIDGDGDLDLLMGGIYGNLDYFENYGTPTAPSFAPPVGTPFGLSSTNEFASPTIGDLDGDGDLDIMVGEYYGVFQYFENVDPTNSIEETTITGSIDPNPFTNFVNFNFDQNIVFAEFVNLTGQTILVIKNPGIKMDVSSLDPGVYIVKCTHLNEQQSTYKLQKR